MTVSRRSTRSVAKSVSRDGSRTAYPSSPDRVTQVPLEPVALSVCSVFGVRDLLFELLIELSRTYQARHGQGTDDERPTTEVGGIFKGGCELVRLSRRRLHGMRAQCVEHSRIWERG